MAIANSLVIELRLNYEEKAAEFGEWSEESHKAWLIWAKASGELNR